MNQGKELALEKESRKRLKNRRDFHTQDDGNDLEKKIILKPDYPKFKGLL